MTSHLLSVATVAPYGRKQRAHLTKTVAAGRKVLLNLDLTSVQGQRLQEAIGFVFRRWVLNILLAVRYHEELSYNEVKAALSGLASGSLAPKLQQMVDEGFLRRKETGGRVVYCLTPEARPVGSAVYALTLGKAERYHAAHDEHFTIDLPKAIWQDVGAPSATAYRNQRDRFAKLADKFADMHHDAIGEHPLATAFRFTQTCVHRWHGSVLTVAEFSGGATYSDLKSALGLSDAALSKAIKGLLEIHALQKDPTDQCYRATKWGRFDVALGCPVPALTTRMWEQQGRYAENHSAHRNAVC